VLIGIPYGASALRPVRALARWRDAAGITAGRLLRRIWTTPRPKNPPPGWTPIHVVGRAAVDPGTIARIVKARGAAAGFDQQALGGRGRIGDNPDLHGVARTHPQGPREP
jgi:hypothetical protein